MNSKDYKKYALINQILSSNPKDNQLSNLLLDLGSIDFGTAFDVWEYMLNTFQKELSDSVIAANIETEVFTMFTNLSETKTRQLLTASDPLIKLIYGSCATSCSHSNLTALTNLILAGKLDTADTILNAVRSNPNGDFGDFMRIIVDSVFRTYCESKGVKKCELTRKQSTLLLDHINKIKGPNKLLLAQRIKEL